MSLKCSIFGHKYAAPDVERERDEQGSEVVITIRELETCVRCGDTRVVSENKEVTTLETPDLGESETPETAAGVGDSVETGGVGDEGAVAGSAQSEHLEEATDAEIIDDDEPAPEAAPDADSGGAPAASPAASPTDSPDVAGGDAGPGDGATDDPESSAPDDDDGVILEEGSDDSPSDRKPGEWPQESDEEEEPDWVAETDPAPQTLEEQSPEIESAASAMSVPEGEFYCGECGFTAAIEASSLRDGDFCPECHQGTLQTRPTEE